MSRKLRYVPEGVRLVHVTCRTIQGRYLFTPSQRFNDIALGVFGRAQRMHPIRICEIEVVSGYFHILFDVDSVQQEVEEEAAADRERSGIPVLGPGAILAQDPQHRPKKLSKSPAPFVHSATKAARQALYQSYSWFVGEFRKAAEKLRRGERDVSFPPGCFRRPCLSCPGREG
jgi:hypothetical protein